MIKAILWDIDNTLLSFQASERAAIKRCFEIFSLGECTDEMVREYDAINDRYWNLLEAGRMAKPEILVGRFREFFSNHGLDVSVAEAFNDEYQFRLSDEIVFCDGAPDVLLQLKGRYIQCAASNGTKVSQTLKLKKSGLDRILDRIYISEDVGFEKPRREYFDAVLADLSPLKPREVLMVGDSLTSDMRGSFDYGLVTCWYNPGGTVNGTGMVFDHVISHLSEVPDILELYGSSQEEEEEVI